MAHSLYSWTEIETLVINRSIDSRGTPDFNKVTSDRRPLPSGKCAEVEAALERLLPTTDWIYQLAQFVNALKERP